MTKLILAISISFLISPLSALACTNPSDPNCGPNSPGYNPPINTPSGPGAGMGGGMGGGFDASSGGGLGGSPQQQGGPGMNPNGRYFGTSNSQQQFNQQPNGVVGTY
ncbi:MAG: hypothetical protein F4094_06650 [Synechococcus sp. SB0672_bin_6]|nr:hypothetical protein [Synechococcus sp. SB0675_bin_6]MYJ60140.1 hypothetical protein [Synechococcus sp. SB0672_bin_6]